MVDIVAIGSGLKVAYDLAKAAKSLDDQVRINTAISEIMEQLTQAQFGLMDMQQQYQELLDENRMLKDRLEQKQRFEDYTLRETSSGGEYILELRPELVTPDRPAHAICPQCKEDGRLSILPKFANHYRCKKCLYFANHTKLESPSLNELGNKLL